jgi:hypothetical protein
VGQNSSATVRYPWQDSTSSHGARLHLPPYDIPGKTAHRHMVLVFICHCTISLARQHIATWCSSSSQHQHVTERERNRALYISVFSHSSDFTKTWPEGYAFRGHPKAVLFDFLWSVITAWRKRKLGPGAQGRPVTCDYLALKLRAAHLPAWCSPSLKTRTNFTFIILTFPHDLCTDLLAVFQSFVEAIPWC